MHTTNAKKVNARLVAKLIDSLVDLPNATIKASICGTMFVATASNSNEWSDLLKKVGKGASMRNLGQHQQDEDPFQSKWSKFGNLNKARRLLRWWEDDAGSSEILVGGSNHISRALQLGEQFFGVMGGVEIVEAKGEFTTKSLLGEGFTTSLLGDYGIDGQLRELVNCGKVKLIDVDVYYPAKVAEVRVEGKLHYLCLMQGAETRVAFLLNPKESKVRLNQGAQIPKPRKSELKGIIKS
jgi:hypothetical protein